MMVRAAVDCRLSKAAAARRFNTTPRTVRKWIERLRDRSSRPLFSPSEASPAVCAAVEALRRQRHAGKQIAAEVGVSAATVSRIPKRFGLNRLAALEPAEPVRRYERAAPGRAPPHRHREARQVQSHRSPDHRRQDRQEQHPRGRMGACGAPQLERQFFANHGALIGC
jgi:transposase